MTTVLFSSLYLPNTRYWPSVRSIWQDIWPNSLWVQVEANEKNRKKEWRQYPVNLTEQAWSIGFILWQNYRGFDSQRFVLLLFSVLRVGRLPKHWFISFFSITLPSVVCVKAKRYHGPLRDTIARTHVFRSPNTLETPRNEAVYLSISSTDIFKTNRNLLSMRCGEKIPAWLVWDQIARVTSRCLEHFGWCACGST